jgi:hypothetical protein
MDKATDDVGRKTCSYWIHPFFHLGFALLTVVFTHLFTVTVENIVDYFTSITPLAPPPKPNPENVKLKETHTRYEEIAEALQDEIDMWEKLRADADSGKSLVATPAPLSAPSPGRRASRGGKKEEPAQPELTAEAKKVLERFPAPPKVPDGVDELLKEVITTVRIAFIVRPHCAHGQG